MHPFDLRQAKRARRESLHAVLAFALIFAVFATVIIMLGITNSQIQ